MEQMIYAGLDEDIHAGITPLGKIVLDARVFGLIPDDETCAGWDHGRIQVLLDQVNQEWDKYGILPSRLPDELRARHARIHDEAIQRARESGWDPDGMLDSEDT